MEFPLDYPVEAPTKKNLCESMLSRNELITIGSKRGEIPVEIVRSRSGNTLRIVYPLLTGRLPLSEKSVIRLNDARAVSRHTRVPVVRSRPSIICTFLSGAFISRARAVPWYRRAPLVIETARYRPVRTTSKTPARIFIIRQPIPAVNGAPLHRSQSSRFSDVP